MRTIVTILLTLCVLLSFLTTATRGDDPSSIMPIISSSGPAGGVPTSTPTPPQSSTGAGSPGGVGSSTGAGSSGGGSSCITKHEGNVTVIICSSSSVGSSGSASGSSGSASGGTGCAYPITKSTDGSVTTQPSPVDPNCPPPSSSGTVTPSCPEGATCGTGSEGSGPSNGGGDGTVTGGPIVWSNATDPSYSVCTPACSSTQTCRFNTCVTKRDPIPCPSTCATQYGDFCDSTIGMCVTAPNPKCDFCPGGLCVRQPFPGKARPPICITPGGDGPSGNSSSGGDATPVSFQQCTKLADCGGIATGNICLYKKCVSCGPICSALQSNTDLTTDEKLSILAGLSQSGAPFTTVYKYIRNVVLLDLEEDGSITLPYNGTILRLENAIIKDKLKHLKLEHDNSAASIDNGETVQVPQLTAQATNGQVLVGDAATLQVTEFAVQSGSDVTVVLTKSSSTGSSGSTISISSLDLNGQLNIVGDSTTSVVFPSKRASVKTSEDGQVNVGGGVSLGGEGGDVPLRIVAASSGDPSSGTTSTTANIPTTGEFHHSGPIYGDSGAVLGVQGTFDYDGTSISPELQVSTGAVVRVEVKDGSVEVRAGDLSFPHVTRSDLKTTLLQINATSTTAGKALLFGILKDCPSDVTVRYYLRGAARRAAALRSGITLMTYAKISDSRRFTFQCKVQICDDDGCDSVPQGMPQLPAGATRRLLSDYSPDTVVAKFGETQLTVGEQGGFDDRASATSFAVVSMTSFLVAFFGAMMGMMMM